MTAPPAEDDVELCHPTEGPIWAYYGRRAITRKSSKGEPLHAVAGWSRLGGALDSECGVIGAIEVGPWDPDAPGACPRCARFIAGEMPMPPERPAAPQPVPFVPVLATAA